MMRGLLYYHVPLGNVGLGRRPNAHTAVFPYNALFNVFLLVFPNKTSGSESRDHILIIYVPPGSIPLSDIELMLNAFLLRNLIFKSNILHHLLIFMHFFYMKGYSMVRLGGRQLQGKPIQRKHPRHCYWQRIDAIMSSTAGII